MVLTACTGFGTSGSVTSSARDFPEPGSGDKNAMRGVDSQQSISQVWAIQRTWARRSCPDG